jgi:uncharacterized protein with HEPN domain
MLEAINTILERTNDMSFKDFVSDKIQFGGIVYQTMIIGEASYKLSREFVASHPQTPWQDIADMRHHLVHGYYNVDANIVWNVILHDLHPLREQIARYLSDIDWDEWERQTTINNL